MNDVEQHWISAEDLQEGHRVLYPCWIVEPVTKDAKLALCERTVQTIIRRGRTIDVDWVEGGEPSISKAAYLSLAVGSQYPRG